MYHKIVIVGNLGRDPDMRYLPDGKAVTTLSVAANDTYTDKNGNRVSKPVWFKVTVWGKQAETANQYLTKGRKVLVEGQLQATDQGNPRTYEKKDGTVGVSFEVRADTVKFLDAAPSNGGSGARSNDEDEDGLPF